MRHGKLMLDGMAISANASLSNSMESISESAEKKKKNKLDFISACRLTATYFSLPECCVNILMPGSGTLTGAVLPGGVPVLLPGSRGLLPTPLPRFPFPWCGWGAWGCGGWSPVDVPSPTRPTCCPIPVVWREDEASKPPCARLVHIPPKLERPGPNTLPQSLPRRSFSGLK